MTIDQHLISHNFTKGRGGGKIKFIVLHTMAGYARNCFAHFNNPQIMASANYGVWLTGKIEQYVRDSDTSWANSKLEANRKSISIEFEDAANPDDSVRTNELYQSGAELIAMIIDKYMPGEWPTPRIIRKHSNFNETKSCPAGLDVDRLCDLATDILARKRMMSGDVVKSLKYKLKVERGMVEQYQAKLLQSEDVNKALVEQISELKQQVNLNNQEKVEIAKVLTDMFGGEFDASDFFVEVVEETVRGLGLMNWWYQFVQSKVKSEKLRSILLYDIFTVLGWLCSLPTVGVWLTQSGIASEISRLTTIPELTIIGLATGTTAAIFKLLVTRYDTNKDGKLDLSDTLVLKDYVRGSDSAL